MEKYKNKINQKYIENALFFHVSEKNIILKLTFLWRYQIQMLSTILRYNIIFVIIK